MRSSKSPTRSAIPSLALATSPALAADLHLERDTHLQPNVVNEARFGFNRFSTSTTPNAQLNPADFGILNGISEPIGLPQINVAGGGLNFGGPAPNRLAEATQPLSWRTRRLAFRTAFD